MLQFSQTKIMPYTAKQLFELVLDIESYPEFLPCCSNAKIIQKNNERILADLTIRFNFFVEKYRSIVEPRYDKNGKENYKIEVKSIKDGPLKSLNNIWVFESQGDNALVTLNLRFEVKSIVLEQMIKIVFNDTAYNTMVAFENRAKKNMVKFLRKKLYEGSSKIIYQGNKEGTLIQYFKDDLKINNKETIQVSGKGILNNTISAYILSRISMVGINHHLIKKINMREQFIYALDIIPVKVYVTSISSGKYVSQFGIEEGYVFDNQIIDFRVKNPIKDYPIINEDQIMKFNWMDYCELKTVKKLALKSHNFLTGLFAGRNIRLVECQLEFGRAYSNEDQIILLADEITPDTCKLWDLENNYKLGHEKAFTQPNNAIDAYKEIAQRINIQRVEC